MGNTRYIVKGYEMAERIMRDFDRGNRAYLKSLISAVTQNGEYADSLDYSGLLREGLKIRGIAQKMLRNRESALEKLGEEIRDIRSL